MFKQQTRKNQTLHRRISKELLDKTTTEVTQNTLHLYDDDLECRKCGKLSLNNKKKSKCVYNVCPFEQ